MGRQKKINPAVLYFPAGIQEKLCYLRQYPLTVIHAPAGFGKSTALRRFFEQNVSPSTPVLWHTFLARQPSASCPRGFFCGLAALYSPSLFPYLPHALP